MHHPEIFYIDDPSHVIALDDQRLSQAMRIGQGSGNEQAVLAGQDQFGRRPQTGLAGAGRPKAGREQPQLA
jgi:hypothetical protein